MIEKTIRLYLESELNIPVYMESPKDAPEEFILLEKTSSSERNHVLHATLAIQSYASSKQKAAELNEKVKDILRTSRDYLDNVSASKLNADYDYADTSKKKYRYQAVFDFTYLED